MSGQRGQRAPRKTRALTIDAEAFDIAIHAQAVVTARGQNFAAHHDDPIGFARDVLGFEPWEGQREVAQAIVDHDFVSNPAGRAVGKSRLDGWLALWFALTRPASRVIFTAPTYKQVQQIVWEEIRILVRGAKIPLPIEVAKMASTGARTSEGSQILGITAEKPEAFQGIRGSRMLMIADEASGISEDIFHVIDGNTAGGAKFILTGNPTRARGYFRESMRSPRFKCIVLPSTESPNVKAGRTLIPGLATLDWLEARKREWGEDSPLYKIHVLGQVAEAEEGRLFSVEAIAAAESRWSDTPATGRLIIGLDPAGASGRGDESAFAARRGNKVVWLHAKRGLSEAAHVTEILGIIAVHKGDSAETPLVIVDRDGYVGAKVYAELSAYAAQNPKVFAVVGVRGGEKARRKPLVYDRVRDEVWYGLVDAFREGLAIPTDVMLSRELSEVRAESHISGRSKVTSKDDLIRALGRSPDRADALSLCTVAITDWQRAPAPVEQANQNDPYVDPRTRGIDPYAALDAWR